MKKGGYKIIDLKDYNITGLGVKIAGVHKEILDNKRKVILLSGVQINGVEFSDMFVKVVKTGTDFRLTGYSVAVDGTLSTYDFYVEDDDTVTLIEDEVETDVEQLFKATYGTTTYLEVVEALTEDKLVIAVQNNEVYLFANIDDTNGIMAFYNVSVIVDNGSNYNYLKMLFLDSENSWANSAINLNELMVNPMTTAGDMIAGSINGVPYRLPKGTQGQFLVMGSTFPEWTTVQSANGQSF